MGETERAPDKNTLWRSQFYRQCQEIVHQIMSNDSSVYFFRPVDPDLDGAPNYYDIIPHPMSIYRVQEKLDSREYSSPGEFIADMRQIWVNAKQYNYPTHPIYKAADALAAKFELLAASLPQPVGPGSRDNAMQRYVELRLLRYRALKCGHA